MGDGFYRSEDPTNSIKVLKEKLQRKNQKTQTTKYTYTIHTQYVHANVNVAGAPCGRFNYPATQQEDAGPR